VRIVADVRESTLPPTGGIYSVSRIGFTAGLDSAIVVVHFACGGLCGSGNYWLYVREANGWKRRVNIISFVN
jgi:hypothetical protein